MARHLIEHEEEYLRRIVEYHNKITAQLVDGFHTESNKISYLRYTIISKRYATNPLKNIFKSQYSFDQLKMELNESVQPEEKIESTSIYSRSYYNQITTHPKDVRKYDSSHWSDSRNNGEGQSYIFPVNFHC